MMTRIAIAGLFSFCIAFAASAQSNPANAGSMEKPLTFRSDSDTAHYYAGESRATFTLSSLEDYDTTHIRNSTVAVLISGVDTLVITATNQPVEILMISPTDTVFETMYFTDEKLEALKQFSKFGNTPVAGIGNFYYSGPSDSLLVGLRTKFNLDSIAGSGSEVQKILNLMEWAHTIVRHDGNSTNPEPRNALNLIQVCRDEDRGVNCRMMATILNEAYLSMGFQSRHITCQPQDKNDPDCHVTCMVFSRDMNKWLLMDPTFGGYFMDEDSTILGPEEIRQRMVDGSPLLLPDGMDWNGTPRPHDEYMKYMTKNLFRFSCPLGSEAGYESKDSTRTWVYLDPVGYDTEMNGIADTSGTGDNLAIDYRTDNAAYFWAKP